MHLEFLVEELSAKECLEKLLPKILPQTVAYEIRYFQGKSDLLNI